MERQKSCAVCTLLNPEQATYCELCSTPFPTKQITTPSTDGKESEDERDRLFDAIDAHLDHLTLKDGSTKDHYICVFDREKFSSKNQFRMHLYRQHQFELRQLQDDLQPKVSHKRAADHEPIPLINLPSSSKDDMEKNDALFALQLGLQFYEEDCLATKDSFISSSSPNEKTRHAQGMRAVFQSPQIRRIRKRQRVPQTEFFKTTKKKVQEEEDSDSEGGRHPGPEERSQRMELLVRRMDRMHAQIQSSLSAPHEVTDNIEAPMQLRGTLRNYQLGGLRWLYSLYSSGMNGILADEMVRRPELNS